MAKDLVIVESPTKARTIGRMLGRDHTVMASLGHVRDLPTRRLGVDIAGGFTPEYVIEAPRANQRGRRREDKAALVKEIAAAARKAGAVYLATDPDREGEAISWHLMEAAGLDPARCRRVVFHEITQPAVEEAFAAPRDIDMDLVNAQQARRVLDRLVGYKLSPLVGRHLKYSGLTAGRVQSAALRMVVDRELAIEAFVPVESWTIEAALRQAAVPDPPAFTARLHGRDGDKAALGIPDEAAATALLADLDGASYAVSGVQVRPVKSRPQAPFITSTLQQEASRKLRFGANKTMSVAQQLYEGVSIGKEGDVGLITYMRTDSTLLADSAVQEIRGYIAREYGKEYVPPKPRSFARKVKGAQEAHEAIRPTSTLRTPQSLRSHLSQDQMRLYTLIWQRAVASQMADAALQRTTAEIRASAPGRPAYRFRAVGSVVTFPGFRALYSESRDDDEEDEASRELPPLAAGDQLACAGLTPEQHFTEPPPRYSEASLVRALEERGIGRPSTYASIVTTIQERGYVERERNRLSPTLIGRRVNEFLSEHFAQVVDLDFTARLEDELDEVAQGERDWREMLRDFYDPFDTNLQRTAAAAPSDGIAVGEACDICGKPMILKRSRWGNAQFLGCSGFPECNFTKPVGTGDAGEETDPPLSIVDEVCDLCGKPMIIKRTRWGKQFLSCSGFPECKSAKDLVAKDAAELPPLPEVGDIACDKCGRPMAVRRRKRDGAAFLGCSGYPKCKNIMQLPVAEGAEEVGDEQPSTLPEVGEVACDQCGKPMKVRRRKRDGSAFLGCSGYPRCKNAAPLPLPTPCPECEGLLVQENADTARCTNCAYTGPLAELVRR